MGIAAALRRAARAVVGHPIELPSALLERYPELRTARWRSGGLPPRVGGWCLGQGVSVGDHPLAHHLAGASEPRIDRIALA